MTSKQKVLRTIELCESRHGLKCLLTASAREMAVYIMKNVHSMETGSTIRGNMTENQRKSISESIRYTVVALAASIEGSEKVNLKAFKDAIAYSLNSHVPDVGRYLEISSPYLNEMFEVLERAMIRIKEREGKTV